MNVDGQQVFGFTSRSPWLARDREKGNRHLQRRLVFLACRELADFPSRASDRTQAKLREKTREIYLRHFPADGLYGGVPERTIRHDPLCRRMHRRLRGLPRALRRPADPSLTALSAEQLLEEIAKRDAAIAGLRRQLQAERKATALAEAMLLRSTARRGEIPAADLPEREEIDRKGLAPPALPARPDRTIN